MNTTNLIWGFSLLLLGCGAEGPAGSGGGQLGGSNLRCVSGITPCGGSVVGSWDMESTCANSTNECQPQAVAYTSGYGVTYNADGTFSLPPVHYTATWATP